MEHWCQMRASIYLQSPKTCTPGSHLKLVGAICSPCQCQASWLLFIGKLTHFHCASSSWCDCIVLIIYLVTVVWTQALRHTDLWIVKKSLPDSLFSRMDWKFVILLKYSIQFYKYENHFRESLKDVFQTKISCSYFDTSTFHLMKFMKWFSITRSSCQK